MGGHGEGAVPQDVYSTWRIEVGRLRPEVAELRPEPGPLPGAVEG